MSASDQWKSGASGYGRGDGDVCRTGLQCMYIQNLLCPKMGEQVTHINYTISVDGIIFFQKDIKTSKMDHQNWVPTQGVDQQLVVDQLFGC